MTRKRNYFFMHFRGDSRASFGPNRPFVLLPQVVLIKNVISLINCLTALAAGSIVFVALCSHWLSQGTESERKHGLLSPLCHTECLSFTLCMWMTTCLSSGLYNSSNIHYLANVPNHMPSELGDGRVAACVCGWKVKYDSFGLCPSGLCCCREILSVQCSFSDIGRYVAVLMKVRKVEIIWKPELGEGFACLSLCVGGWVFMDSL